jgi:cysteine desulfurase
MPTREASGERMLSLDNAITTQPTSKVLKAYREAERKLLYATPYEEIEAAKRSLYALVGAKEEDLFCFTAGERENAAFVLYGNYFDHIVQTGKNFLMAPITERASLLKTMERLENVGCELLLLSVDASGRLTREILEKHFSPKISLLALSWVNSLTGVIQPIAEISDWCQEKGIRLYVEASEVFTKHFFRFQDLSIDYLSFAGELFHAPQGTGGVFMKKKSALNHSLFPETYTNIPGLIALGAAANEMMELMDSALLEVARLRASFEERLSLACPAVIFFGREAMRLPNTSAFAFPQIHGEALLFLLHQKGIKASRGGGSKQILSGVLQAAGAPIDLAEAAVTVTFSMMTDESEVEKLLKALVEIAL